MTLKKKHCLLLLAVILVLLISITNVSATDTNNTTQVVQDNNKLSTPANYDVDNVVQSDLKTLKSDADVEEISDTSNTIKNKDIQANTATNNKTIEKSNKTIKQLTTTTVTTFQQLRTALQSSGDNEVVINLGSNIAISSSVTLNYNIKKLTINGNSYTLSNYNYGFLRATYSSNITLENINFYRVSQPVYQTSGNLTIRNCNFTNITSTYLSGGVIYHTGGNLEVTGSRFENVNVSTTYNSYGYGSAIYHSNGNASIIGSKFINNTLNVSGTNGYGLSIHHIGQGNLLVEDSLFANGTTSGTGQISYQGSGNLTVRRVNFTNNYAHRSGAAIYTKEDALVDNCIFINNSVKMFRGAAFYLDDSNSHKVILNNSLFVNSTASAGAAVFITKAEAIVDNCTFIGGNVIDWNGGGIRQYNGNLTVLNSNFINNTAKKSGGAISFDESSSESRLVVNNSNFTNNIANENGGAIDHRQGNTTISNSVFTNNSINASLTSGIHGGAVYKKADNLTLNNVTFINNTAPRGSAIGGGFDAIINNSKFIDNLASNGTIYTTGVNVSINGSIFDNNTATLGGGIYMSNGNLIVNATNASNNNASVRGGVIFLQSGNLNVSDSNFTNNTATEHGGAIFHNDGNERIVNSTFIKNGVNMTGAVAQAGGGAIYKQYGDMEVINSTFSENYLDSSYPSTGGAAIYKQRGNLLVNGSNFTKNNATTEGAAIYHSASTLLIDSSNFTENVATNASVICQKDGTITNITNSTFKNNKAENDAGVIYNTKGTLYINSSEISSNTAGVNAGALYVNDGKTTIENSNITDNTALTGGFIVTKSAFESTNNSIGNNKATTGGVIYLNSTTSSLKSNYDVVENNSAVNGALVYSYSGISDIDNAVINNNTASGNGTIFNSNSARVTLTNSNVTNNTADKGAVVYNSKGATSIITNNNIINNTAVEGAVLCNNGTSSVSNNNITSNKVTGAEYFVIDNIDTLTLSNNNFTNNTDNTRDMLLDSKNDKITVSGNTYVGNYLNITIDAENVTAYGHDGINTVVPLTLRTIYNDIVRNGNITVKIGDYETVAEVNNGRATIIIPDEKIVKNQINEVQLSYESPDNSYQKVESTFNIISFLNTSINIDINGNFEVNSPITYTVTLKNADNEVMASTPINITLNGVTQEYTTSSEGTVIITQSYPTYGNRLIRAEYMGDTYYNYSVSELRHPVNKIDTKINIVTQNTGSAPLDDVPIEVTLTDKYGNVIPEKTVVVKLLNNSIEVNRFTLTTDENGKAQCVFTPQFAANYEVEATYNGELDEVYYSTVEKQNILVEKITPVIILRNTTETYNYTETGFKVVLTGRGDAIVDAPLDIRVTLKDGRILTFTNPTTDEHGEYAFSFTRADRHNGFTVTVSYGGNERYYSNSFTKPFDEQKRLIYQNITATDTFINKTNDISIEVRDENGNGLNGTFEVSYLNGTIIGTTEVKDGFGSYLDFKSAEYIPELIINGRFINDSYISVVESVPFKVMKLEPNIAVDAILNETVYNTTLKIQVFNPKNSSSIVHDGRLVIRHLDNVVGEADVVDGYAVVTLNGVDRNRFYALTISYLGNDYFRGRESQTRIEPQKLPVDLQITALNNTAGNVSLRIDVTSEHDPSVNNGTVYIVKDGTEEVIAQGQVQGGAVIINVSSQYFKEVGTYPLDIKYSDSLTFLDTDKEYELIVNARPTVVTPNKNNTVINEATIDVVLRDATTNEVLGNCNITVYDLNGIKIADGKTDENGFVTLPINLPVGQHDLIIKYSGNKTYLESSAPLLMNIDYRNATITPEILDTVTDNVTIKATFTDTDNGNPITSGDIAILYKDGEPIAQTVLNNEDGEVVFEGLHLPVGEQNLEIRLLGDGIYNQTSKFITVDVQYRNLTIDFEQVNKYVTEATINVTLKDKDTDKIIEANIIIYDANGYVVGRGNTEFDELFVNLPAGKYNITVEYPEDGVYNKTNFTKEIEIIKRDSEIRLNLNRRNLILSEIVSIDGRLFDANNKGIANATVNLYIDNVPAAILKTNDVGAYFYEYTTDKVGTDIMVNVIYEGSNVFNPSNNNIPFNVSKIPTITNVEVLNSTIGNVTLKINVTNMTDELLTNGRVVVRNASDYDDILGTGHLLNGVVTIKLDVDTPGLVRFNVTYLGDDKYLESNATNTTDDVTIETINIFTVDVQKQNSTITINLREDELTIGESVIIYGNVFDENNRIISSGTVNVMINDTVYPVELINGLYILRNVTGSAGLFNVNATYTGSTNISECSSENITYTVNKIATTTSVEVLNNTVGNVTIEITVTNATGTPVANGSINVVFNNGTAIETGKALIDGKVVVNIPTTNLEDLKVNVTYLGDDTYLPSNATNSTASEDMENTTVINVTKQDATITINLDQDNVTISETVTITGEVRDANGELVTSGTVTVLVGGVEQPVTFENGVYTVRNVTATADSYIVNATYTNEDGYYNPLTSENKTFIVNKIPTKTNVEVVNTTFGNVTILVNVTNTTATPETVTTGNIHVVDSLGNEIATQTTISGESVLIKLTGITDVGITQIGVYYDENNIYLASNAKNETAIGQNNENLITINVTKIPTTISKVEILSNLSNNITLNISVTNTTETPEGVTTGTVVVYDTQGNELARGNVDNVGNVTISVPNENTDKLEVVIKYIENDLYLNSTATNASADPTRQNITIIPIDKIPTITTADIVNNTIGNVVINVNVTNTTSQPVTTGHVVVRNQTGTIIGEGDLINGGVNITLNVNTPGQLKVNITYQENNIYYSSNTQNSSLTDEDANKNITNIEVAKLGSIITINTDKNSVTIGESVLVYGTVVDSEGKIIKDGQVKVTINGTQTLVNVVNGTYNTTYVTNIAGEIIANATYIPADGSNISKNTSENTTFTVNKIPTTTTVEILNNTIGNVTIEITVTNATGTPVISGKVSVVTKNGSVIEAGKDLVDGKVVVNIPTTNLEDLQVNVTYLGDDTYLPSNATNSTAADNMKNTTVINVEKQDATITIELNDDNVTIGETVTITGQVRDANGVPVTSGSVTVLVGGEPQIVEFNNGAYTVHNVTVSAGTFVVNATYTNDAGNYNPVTSENKTFTVNKIPTTTKVTVLNNTVNNVTISVVVKDENGTALHSGKLNITVAGVTTPVDFTDATPIKLNITSPGNITVKVDYLGNDTYLPSEGINSDNGEVLENITTAAQTAKITIATNATETNILGDNISISGKLTNATDAPIANAIVTVTVNGTNYTATTDSEGNYQISVIADKLGEVIANATYNSNPAYNNVTSSNVSYTVGRIPTKTNIMELVNNSLDNVVIKVNVTNNTGSLVPTGHVVAIDATNGNILGEADLTNGIANILLDGITKSGESKVNVTFTGTDVYLPSNATGNSNATGEENTTIITVLEEPTIDLTIDPNNVLVGEVVPIIIDITNKTGKVPKDAIVIVTINGKENYSALYNETSGNYYVEYNNTIAGKYEVTASYILDADTIIRANDTFNVNKIPTKTNVEVVNTTYGNVTIRVNVTNTTATPETVTTGNIHVVDSLGNEIAIQTTISGQSVLIKLTGITDVGITQIGVYYDENNIYLASNAKNESAIGQNNENLITINVTKIPTTISKVEILSNLSNNITLNISVTNTTETPEGVTTGTVVVYDTEGNELNRADVDNKGNVTITVPNNDAETLEVVIKYIENDLYLNSTATNASADPTRQNITIIPIDKIPTITTAAIVNNTIGNVVINVNVTNTTSQPVTTGHVVVHDQTGTIVGEGDLVNGGANITLNVNTPGPLKVNITYQENNIYYPSNAQNSSLSDEDANKNITNIEVAKLASTVTIKTDKTNVTIGENVLVYGTVVDSEGKIIKDGQVKVTINGTDTLVNVVNGTYNTIYVTNIAGEIIANATYIPADGSNISKNTSENTTFTVNKIPTTTTVEVLNNTIGNVTVEITVTNATGTPVANGSINVVFNNGTAIETGKALVDGKVIVEIPTTNLEDLKVNVTYLGDDTYLPSNATNSTADEDMKNTTVINVEKQDATITITLDDDNVTIGETVTITGEVRDANNEPVTSGTVTVLVGGEPQIVEFNNGAYTVHNVTVSAGTFVVNATYTNDGYYNPVTSENKTFTVNKLPTTTTIEVLNNTANNVTINVTVKDENGTVIPTGKLNITVAGVTTPVELTNDPIRLNITSPGNITVKVDYLGNDTYLSSQATQNITVANQTAKITITTNATETNILGDNISISGKLTNATDAPIANAIVTVTVNGTNYTAITDNDGNYQISVIADKLGEVIVNATYNSNPAYNNVTSSNVSYTVGMIPTKTNVVEIVDDNLGNVVIKVNVTNSTGDLVPNGHVIVINAENGNTIGEADLINGIANITLTGITEAGEAKVNVTFTGTNVYLPSNATGNSIVPGEENTTVIRVVGSPTITMDLDKNSVNIGEEVTVNVNVTDDLGEPISTGTVTVIIGDTPKEAIFDEDSKNWTVTYTPEKAGEFLVNATFTNETVTINTENDTLTVNKLPTTTTVELLNNTVGNTTISVVVEGNSSTITEGQLNITVGGKDIIVPINSTGRTIVDLGIQVVDDVPVNVVYNGSDVFLPSNGVDTAGQEFVNVTTVEKTSDITVVAQPDEDVIIGDEVLITGNLTDSLGNNITDAYVDIYINDTYIATVRTNENGTYNYTYIPENTGEINATVVYEGSDDTNATNNSVVFNVGRIPTTTTAVVTNVDVNNVTVEVTVVDKDNKLVTQGTVVITDAANGNTLGEGTIVDGKANITLDIAESGDARINVTYLDNEVYITSNATGNSTNPEEPNTIEITVFEEPTISLTIDPTIVKVGEIVPIIVDITNKTGELPTDANVTVTVNGNNYKAIYNETLESYVVMFNDTLAGEYVATATYKVDEETTITSNNDSFTVDKIPTATTVTILNNTANNVTISVVVKDENGTIIPSGKLNITVAGVTTPVDFTDATLIRLNITSPGDITVKVDYTGNDTYLPSEGINSDNGEVLENITTATQTAKITIATNATETNILGDNISISGKLTNATDAPIANAIVTVTVNGTNYTATTDNDGNYQISVIADKLGEVIANATYNTNPAYNNATSTNVSYVVGMIPTKTNVVEIVNNSLGNVVIKVNVTNNTDDLVLTGHVVAIDATSGNTLGEADLTNGIANITLTSITESGEVKVNVTFTGTDVYLPSNATGNSSITGEENTTVFTVLEEPTITLTVDPDTYKVGEVVPIFVDITNKTGEVPTDADVTVTINDVDYTAVYNETIGKYVVQYNDTKAGIYNVTASYKVDEETTINSNEDSFTVEKLPTTTTVELLDNTVGNVTIRVTVVGNDSTICEGQLNITVGGKTQTEPINDTGVTTIKLDIDVVDDVLVNVVYNGSDVFLPSNGTDTQGRDFVNITTKERTSIISIVAEPSEGVIIGDNVTISGNLTDNLGNNITDAYVDLYINDSYVATIRTDNNGAYTYTYTPESTGNVNVSVRYLGTVEINGTENSTVFSVGKIATTTTAVVTDVNVNNITVDVTVVDVRGDNVVNGTVVVVDADTGDVLGEATITDGKATIKLNNDDSGDARINVTYTENDVYLPSNATGNSTNPEEPNTIEITVLEEPTITLTIDPDTYKVGEVVPIKVDITNKTGKVPTDADVTVTVNGNDYNAIYNDTLESYIVLFNDTLAGEYVATATYKVDEETTITSNNDSFTVDKIPTTTTVEILNNTANNVTISVVVKDENGTVLPSGKLNITVAGTTTSVDFRDATPIKLNITSPGDIAVKVEYLGNDTYLPSEGINRDNGEVLENITTIAQTAKITIATNATENNIIGDNITISGRLTNATDNPIANAIVTITVNGTNYTATTDNDGNYQISVIADKLGEVIANATYNTNPAYNNATSTNVSYIVGMIPTKTNIVEIVDNSLGNVVLKVNVTNNTGDLVPTGHVVAIDAISANTIGEADLTNGIANITLTGITESGEVKVNVTFTGTDVYLPSNATGNSSITGEENTTVFTVLEEPTIILTIDPDTYKVGEVVSIIVDITNKTGEVPTDADVTVTINDMDYTAVYNETTGNYVVQYKDTKAGIYNVTASYKVDEETTINSDEDSFTVEKLPTITTVEILNNTVGNVTVKVSVTNDTDNAPVTKGKISITDLNGNLLTDATLIDGSVDITIPTTNAGDLRVIVSYDENDIYLPSNATNSSSTGSISEDITLIDVQKQDANINISSNTSNAVIDDKVTINGTVTDGMNQPITDGTVTVTVGNDSYTVDLDENGAYTLEYNATKAGEFIVNATYNGIDDVINPVTSENLDLTVTKKTPVVNVIQTNSTPDNTTLVIDVTDSEGNPVPEGNVTIALPNGTNVTVPVKDGVANVTLDLPVGENDVNVTFEENDEYSSVTIPEVVKTNKLNTTITVDDIDDVTIGENITIKGVLTDEYGRIMPNTNVNITINDDKYHTTTDANGAYAFDYQTATSGVHNVTVDYTGNQTHNPSTNATIFNVDKKTPIINVTQTNSTPDNTTLVIDVTDSEGNPVPEGNVTIALPNGTNVTVPVKDGVANVTLDLPVGENDVNVTFDENDEYSSVTIPEVVKTNKLNTTITVDDIDDVTIGENITIKGVLTDEYGRIMPNTNVNITVNNEKLTTRTDTSGKYSITYKPTKAQSYNVTVAYLGNATHNPSNNKTTFTVNKIPTNTTVTILNNTVGNVKINVKVTNTTNNPVTKGSVKVTDMYGKQVATANLNGGNANITIPTTTAGDLRVIVSYNENDIYLPSNATNSSAAKTPSENITLIDVEKLDAKITINTNTTKATIGDKVTINGTVKDQNNKLIPNGTVTVKVGNDSYTVDLKDGVYKVEYNATKDGKFTINATYNGQDNVINPVTSENKSLTVTKKTPVITVKQDGNKVGNTTLKVNITDKNGTPIQNGTVTVKDPTGKPIATVPVTNGQATIPVDLPAGTQNLTVTYNGNEEYSPINKTQKTNITKTNAILTINPIQNITFYQKTNITGRLTDVDGNPIRNAKVTLDIDGVTQTVITDKFGEYTLGYNTTKVGLNNVTAKYSGDTKYNNATAKATFNASKIITYVTVADVKGTIGDNVTLKATVTDEYGTRITGGQFVFKINGLTLRTNGKFEKNGTPMILSPVNGQVNITIKADKYLRSAVNVTGVYGETYKYYGSRSITPGKASIARRNASITVTTVSTTKQDVNITLKATVTDITHGKNNGPVQDYDDNFVIFKVNGITIKNDDGTAKQVKVVNGTATLDYHVPIGLAGKYTNLTNKKYTVTAVFGSGEYNPGVSNTTQFGVERSPITFKDTHVTLDTKTKHMYIKSDIVDYHDNLLKGTNNLCVKVNGESYKINNKTVYYSIQDGKVDLNIIVPYHLENIHNVGLVTGERVGYLSGRTTINDIVRV